jgi:hypothetical protein
VEDREDDDKLLVGRHVRKATPATPTSDPVPLPWLAAPRDPERPGACAFSHGH